MAIWIDESLAWPLRGSCPSPNADLPEEVLRDYNEASTVLALSARAACALLRLAIQKLCIYLGEKGEYLNEDIASLVRKGLDRRVQRALDTVRVIGNNAVHPGRMDLRDDHATATTLFRLVNLIAQRMLTEAREVDEVYDSLPEGALKQIEERDRRGQ